MYIRISARGRQDSSDGGESMNDAAMPGWRVQALSPVHTVRKALRQNISLAYHFHNYMLRQWRTYLAYWLRRLCLHRFRDIAFERSEIAIVGYPIWSTPSPTKGFPWDDLRKMFIQRSWMAKVPHGVETLPKISIA